SLDAGVEEDEEVDAADRDDPEKEEAERAELRQRIESRAEQAVERLLDQGKADAERAADFADHVIPFLLPVSSRPSRADPFPQDQAGQAEQGEGGDHGAEQETEIDAVAARAGVVGRADEFDAIDDAAEGERR